MDWTRHEKEISKLLEERSKIDGFSYTLTDLSFKPLIWYGNYFSDAYQDLTPNQIFWNFKDNRAVLANLTPFPDEESRSCYLITETLIISSNSLDRPVSKFTNLFNSVATPPSQWISREFPNTMAYQPVFTIRALDNAMKPSKVLDALPVKIQWLPFQDPHSPLEILALVWILLLAFFIGRLRINDRIRKEHVAVASGWFWVFILLLALPQDTQLDHLEVFSSSVFSGMNFLNLFISPYHLLLTALFLFYIFADLFEVELGTSNRKKAVLLSWLRGLFPFLIFLFAFFPEWIERNSSVSLSQPKEAFLGPGSFLVFATALIIPCLFTHLLLRISIINSIPRKVNLFSRILLILFFAALILFFALVPFAFFLTGFCLALVLFLNQIPFTKAKPSVPWVRRLIAGLLIASAFFFQLNILGTRELHQFIQKEWLQEMTLIEQENHNRVMRILDAFKTYENSSQSIDNSYLATWLAKMSGISDEAVGYAIWIIGSEGQTISSAESQISLDNIPYEFSPRNRIEYTQETPEAAKILIFRRPVDPQGDKGEIVIAITNSYQDITSIKRLSPLFKKEGLEVPFKQGSVKLKVYDLAGNPLNRLDDPTTIPKPAYDRLAREPFFFTREGSRTQYFYNNGFQLFMIQVSPLNPVILLARFVLIFCFCWAFLMILHRSKKLKIRSLLDQFRRSFRFRLATLFFCVSLFPMALLMVLFLVQLRNAQNKGEIQQLINKSHLFKKTFDTPKKISKSSSEDIIVFEAGTMKETSRPELFQSSTLSTRLPYDMYRKLKNKEVSYLLEKALTNLPVSLNAIYVLAGPDTILCMTGYADTIFFREALKDQLELVFALAFLILISISFLALNFSRVFLKPIASITRGATKMQRSVHQDPIPAFSPQNELNKMIMAFNNMRETIIWNEKERQKQIDILTITMDTMKTGLLGLNLFGDVILCNRAFYEWFPSLQPPRDLLDKRTPTNVEKQSILEPIQQLNIKQILQEAPELEPILKLNEAMSLTLHIKRSEREFILLARKDVRNAVEDEHEINVLILLEDITPEMETSKLKAWSEMARRIAHEIKNPLTPMLLELDHLNALFMDKHPQFDKALKEATFEIKSQIRQLHKTATDFGDYARPLSIDLKPEKLSSIIHDCVSSYQRTQERIEIDIQIHQDPELNLDEFLTRKAISNLLINSFEAMEQGKITMVLEEKTLDGEQHIIVLSIEDNGPGIPLDEKKRIFEAYFSTKTRGTGLGLAIAHKSIEIQGGKLSLDQEFHGGTRFLIQFPVGGQPGIETLTNLTEML